MEPQTVNSFLDRFLAVADSGFGLIAGDIAFVLNALIIISVTLAGAQWALAQEAPMAAFFRKVLFVGFFAFLINNWDALSAAINQSGAMLGLKAGGDGMSMADLHNPGRVAAIGTEMFGRTAALGEGMNIITDFGPLIAVYVAAFAAMLGFFLLALQVFVALIAFKLGALAAFVALPWGVFSGTSWVAERPIGWVVGSAVRLFVLAFVASISVTFVDSLPATLTLDKGGALNVLLFGLTVMALAWFAPNLASEVVQGQPHLAGADAMRAGQGAAMRAAGATAIGAWGVAKSAGLLAAGGRVLSRAARPRAAGGGSGGQARQSINYAGMRARPRPPASGGTT
jgi:type IV secretion system protein TrbL